MKTATEVTTDKLRGGFYTPPKLVDECFERIAELIGQRKCINILEPAAGDGAFVKGLTRFRSKYGIRRAPVTCIEVIEEEAQKCMEALRKSGRKGTVINASFFSWANEANQLFDVVVGNPPFIRFQFVPAQDRYLAECLLKRAGVKINRLSNFWLSFAFISLNLLRKGGAFALVLPTELFATKSAGDFRAELILNFGSLRIDLYPRNSFPDLLQDVIIVSGLRDDKNAKERSVYFVNNNPSSLHKWRSRISSSGESWTRYFLNQREWESYCEAKNLAEFVRFNRVATMGVSIVTGANNFFTINESVQQNNNLHIWSKPLLARTADCPGLICKRSDHVRARRSGKSSWILDFSQSSPDPMQDITTARYILYGESQNLHHRYKCRIRKPWYRVPHIKSGMLMMAKRAHQHHRIILNKSKVLTTDTIYRGRMKQEYSHRIEDFVAGFHNSLSLLSAELEGRSYGGGVLELIPSEIANLLVPLVEIRHHLQRLDDLSRKSNGQLDKDDTLIHATDTLLCGIVPGYSNIISDIVSARSKLRQRRFNG